MAYEEDKNPTKKIYDTMYHAGQGRWVMSIVVLGLAAAIVAEKPTDPWTLAGGAISIACASVNIFVIGPFAAPRSQTDPRPPSRFYLKLAIITIVWLADFGVMFVALVYSGEDDRYKVTRKTRRAMVGAGAEAIKQGMGMYDALGNIVKGCAGVVAGVIGSCIAQWMYVLHLSWRVKLATEDEVSDALRRLMKKKPEDGADVEAQTQQ